MERFVVTVVLWYCLLQVPVINAEQVLTISTPQQSGSTYTFTKLSNYGYSVGQSTCIVFEVRACHSVHISLMQNDDDTTLTYEVLFGGWSNSRQGIRDRKFSPDLKAQHHENGVVNCAEFRRFKVGWRDGYITGFQWKEPCEWRELMTWYDTSHPVNYIGVTTGIFTSGDWKIFNEGCYHRPNLARDITLDNHAIQSSPRFIADNSITTTWKCAYMCQKDKDCCWFTFNEHQQDCRGYSTITSYNISIGTQVWKRRMF